MASTRGRPIQFEGWAMADLDYRTEILDTTTLEWSAGVAQQFYPRRGDIWTRFATIQRDEDTFYAVGGDLDRQGKQTKIVKYQADVWSHVGDLQIPRTDPSVVFNGNELIIIAGWGEQNQYENNEATDIERWNIETQTGQVDEELTQAMRVRQMYTYIVKVDGTAACNGTS